MTLPTDSKARKDIPMVRGLLDYFPGALAAVAEVSRVANEQHNAGQEMHWAREKSKDHADCIVRHLVDRGALDTDGLRHSAKIAWRALALLQEELEAAGQQPGRASKWPSLLESAKDLVPPQSRMMRLPFEGSDSPPHPYGAFCKAARCGLA